MEVLRRCPLAIAQRLVHCAIALLTAVLDRVTKTMSVAPLLMNNLDNSKQKTSNLLSPAPPPYSWSLLGKSEGPAPLPSSKISWSFDLAWSPAVFRRMTHIYRSMISEWRWQSKSTGLWQYQTFRYGPILYWTARCVLCVRNTFLSFPPVYYSLGRATCSVSVWNGGPTESTVSIHYLHCVLD